MTASVIWSYGTRTLTSALTPIASVQRGTFLGNASSSGSGFDRYYEDVTITAVNLNKSMLIYSGCADGSNPPFPNAVLLGRFTSSTNIRFSTVTTSRYFAFTWQVVEFE
jgi:hypothetical protein